MVFSEKEKRERDGNEVQRSAKQRQSREKKRGKLSMRRKAINACETTELAYSTMTPKMD